MAIETSNELSSALFRTGERVEVSKNLYLHFMDVLPPKAFGRYFFVFQEGAGEVLRFTKVGNHYYCTLLKDNMISEDWKFHARIVRTDSSDKFELEYVISDDEDIYPHDRYTNFIGAKFSSPIELGEKLGVSFRF